MKSLSRSELETIVRGVPAAVLVVEKATDAIAYANENADSLFGANLKGFVINHETKKLHIRFFTLTGQPYVLTELPTRKALAKETEINAEFIVERADSSRVVVRGLAKPVRDDNGKVIAAVGIFEDITERKIADQALRKAEERFRALVESTSDVIWQVDENAVYIYVSPKVKDILGYEPKEVIGKTPFDFVDEKDEEKVLKAFLEIANKKEPFHGLENWNVRKDGSRVLLETSGVPILEENGQLVGYRGIDRDVTERKKAEEALKANKERLELAQQVARLGSWDFFVKEDRAVWSEEMFDIFALNHRNAPRIVDYSKLIYPDDLNMVDTMMQRFLTQGKLGDTVAFDYRIQRPDGSICFLHSKRMIIEVDENGKACRIIGIEQEITERKELEVFLRESEERFKLVAEVAGVLVYEINVEHGTFFIFRGEDVLGYERGEIPTNEEWWLNKIHLEDRAETEQKLRFAMRKGSDYSLEYRIRCKDGNYIFAHDTGKAVLNSDGNVIRFVGGMRDVTERKKWEANINRYAAVQRGIGTIFQEALSTRTEEALNKLCLSLLQDITKSKFGFIGEVDDKGVFHDTIVSGTGEVCNMYDKTGHRRPPGDFKIHGIYGRVLIDGKGFFTNEPNIHPDSIGIPVGHPPLDSFLGVPLVNDRRTIGMIGLANREGGYSQSELETAKALALAVTEAMLRKRAEGRLASHLSHLEELVEERTRQLQSRERLAAIGATAGMVGHDIRNPLQAITADIYLLKAHLIELSQSETKVSVFESLDGIDKNVGYINKIVADLQDYARSLSPEYCFVNLADIADETLKAVDIPETVKVTNNTGYIELRTDAQFIRRALTNLVNNAVQAMPKGGNLTINACESERRVILTVEDTGVGIPDEVKPKLFEPMMTTKAKGQGLGLAVAKRLVEALGGTIAFESEVEKGTKFIIALPATC